MELPPPKTLLQLTGHVLCKVWRTQQWQPGEAEKWSAWQRWYARSRAHEATPWLDDEWQMVMRNVPPR